MDRSGDGALLLQDLPGLQKPLQMGIHGETREFPGDDPGEPHQGAHIKEPDGPECVLIPQNGEACMGN